MFVLGLAAGVILAQPAFAQDFAADIEARLKSQGYTIESVARTLLGRVRIIAENAKGQREIILNPRTGEILRDLWIADAHSQNSSLSQGNDKAEDEDEDNSGHGGGGDNDDSDDDN